MELKELTGLLDIPLNKLDNILQKKGFKKYQPPNPSAPLSMIRSHGDSILQFFTVDSTKKRIYETTSANEFRSLQEEIRNAGFFSPKEDATNIQSLVYQKQVITIETATRTEDSITYYILITSRKDLPKKKEMAFAEDLLQTDSHEYLSEMFGRSNVKTDIFYYDENDSSRCSVIFPNTNLEAIFIWKDEINLRHIDFIVIGGSLRPAQNDVLAAQSFNLWRSQQGPYCGMSLQDLERLNREPIRFFNWNTESAGYLTPKNEGQIDFKKLGLVLNCMNCGFIKVSQDPVLDSATAIEEMQKVYITTLIIIPDK